MDKHFLQERELRRKEKNYQGTTLYQQREPDQKGSGGGLWRIWMAPPEERDAARWGAVVGLWLMHAPNAHPMWEYYVVLLLHLRPLEGYPTPEKTEDRMQYQITVMTIDPGSALPNMQSLADAQDSSSGLRALHPADFEAQFPDVNGDHNAYEIVDELCIEVVNGILIPDGTYRTQWATSLSERVIQRALFPKRVVN